MSRKITFLTLFLWLMTVTFPVIAQQKADTTYTFRFVPQKDMFYVPWNGNDTELARLLDNPGQSPRVPIFCGTTDLPEMFKICGNHCTAWMYSIACS
jgi:hypothetical protein